MELVLIEAPLVPLVVFVSVEAATGDPLAVAVVAFVDGADADVGGA